MSRALRLCKSKLRSIVTEAWRGPGEKNQVEPRSRRGRLTSNADSMIRVRLLIVRSAR
jgi:hypothetical protein